MSACSQCGYKMDEEEIKEIAEDEAKKELGEIRVKVNPEIQVEVNPSIAVKSHPVVQNEAPEIEPEGDTSLEEPEAPVEAPVESPDSEPQETSWRKRIERISGRNSDSPTGEEETTVAS